MKVNKFIAIYGIAIADRREDIWEKMSGLWRFGCKRQMQILWNAV